VVYSFYEYRGVTGLQNDDPTAQGLFALVTILLILCTALLFLYVICTLLLTSPKKKIGLFDDMLLSMSSVVPISVDDATNNSKDGNHSIDGQLKPHVVLAVSSLLNRLGEYFVIFFSSYVGLVMLIQSMYLSCSTFCFDNIPLGLVVIAYYLPGYIVVAIISDYWNLLLCSIILHSAIMLVYILEWPGSIDYSAIAIAGAFEAVFHATLYYFQLSKLHAYQQHQVLTRVVTEEERKVAAAVARGDYIADMNFFFSQW
jgi:hypothetical protein